MRILIVAATPFEIAPLTAYLLQYFEQKSPNEFVKEETSVRILVTGIGQMLTAYAMGYVLAKEDFDFAINAGVAGAYNRDFKIGEVFNIESEQFGDLGAEDADGSFLSIHDLGLLPKDELPFEGGKIKNPTIQAQGFDFLPRAKAVTVNTVNGYQANIEKAQARHQADIESMEGAAFSYICRSHELAFLQIRAISNYVEARNRATWNLPLAIQNLNNVLIEMLKILAN